MKSGNSPIIETNSSRSFATLLLFAFLALGVGYFFMTQENKEVPIAQPIEEPEAPEDYQPSRVSDYSGVKAANVSANKMNVFYIGVDNPISISVAGVPSGEIRVSIAGGGAKIKAVGGGRYIVQPTKPTADCKVTVSAGEYSSTHSFRVKRIPDPVAMLGNKDDGNLSSGEFRSQQGLIAWLHNFDFDAKCQIQGFYLKRISDGQSSDEVVNRGGKYTEQANNLIRAAKPGDEYQFTNVKARCPGDPAGRKINSLVFKIK